MKIKTKQKTQNNAQSHLKGIVLAALFAALLSVMALPLLPLGFTPVPITLQTIGVLLAGAVLGPYYGALSMIIYLLLGTFNLPVFAGGGSGIGAIFGYTGGYLLSYPIAALVIGLLASKKFSAVKYICTIFMSLFAVIAYLDIFLKLGIMKICSVKTKSCITVVSQMTDFQYLIASISLIIIAALIIVGYYIIRKKIVSFDTVLAMFVGTIIIYIGGSIQGKLLTGLPWSAIFVGWVLPFLVGDTIKLLIASYLAKSLDVKKYIK